jgi:hypothetical protein
MIIHVRQSIAGTGTTVTFSQAFKTGTIPTVKGTAENVDAYFSATLITNTGFKGWSTKHDGNPLTANCGWIAIGERG